MFNESTLIPRGVEAFRALDTFIGKNFRIDDGYPLEIFYREEADAFFITYCIQYWGDDKTYCFEINRFNEVRILNVFSDHGMIDLNQGDFIASVTEELCS